MKYIKRIITAMAFLAGLLVLLHFSSKIFMPKNNTKEEGMEYEAANGILAEKENTIDVLFLGDSESYSSIIPMQIWNDSGITSYNCSNGGQNLSYAYTLLHRACKGQNPKLVFLEVNEIYRSQSVANLLYDEACEHFPVLRYHDRWKNMDLSKITSTPEYTSRQFDKGYIYVTTTKPSEEEEEDETRLPTKEKESISFLNRQIVRAMKRHCDSIGAQLVLISVPSTKNWSYKRHNGISHLAEDIGCEFIDMNLLNDELQIDWTHDTRDQGDHLNYKGACKVTKYLSEYLIAKSGLPGHKGDPEFVQWEEDYKLFEEEIKHEKAA